MDPEARRTAKLIAQIAVTLIVLGASLWVILSGRYSDSYVKWAMGLVGVVIGYWLK